MLPYDGISVFPDFFANLPQCCNIFMPLGRGGCTKTRENPGIAKKGEGGSDPCQEFVGGFDIVHGGQLKVIMDP